LIVRCASCQTEFSLDDKQVGREGVTVRCSVCARVFHVDPLPRGIEQPWQIRTLENLLFTAPDLLTLKQWIDEGRLHPDDQVSRTGKTWLRLGDMPELSAGFHEFGGLSHVLTPVSSTPNDDNGAADVLGPPPAFAGQPTRTNEPQPPAATTREAATARSTLSGMGFALEASQSRSGESSLSSESSLVARESSLVSRDSMVVSGVMRRGFPWPIAAGLGVVAAVALVFSIPSVRERMQKQEAAASPGPIIHASAPELARAHGVLERLDPREIGHMEALLQREIDTGRRAKSEIAELKLAQVELLCARAIEYAIASNLPGASDSALAQARDYAERATRIFDTVGDDVPDRPYLSLVRAELRLAEGRSPEEILALLPDSGAQELRLAVAASAIWRDPSAPVATDLVEQLRALDQPTTLSRLVLGLALMRAGDRAGAKDIVDHVLKTVPTQPTAKLMSVALEATVPSPPSVAAAIPTPIANAGKSLESATGEGNGPSGGASERLSSQGCQKVEHGDAAAGVKVLLQAHDLNPKSLDVLVCLGQGHARLGNHGSALAFFERALARSPEHRIALSGAANSAERLGAEAKAVALYKRLARLDPSNAAAQRFMETHRGDSESRGSDEQASSEAD